MDKDVSITLEQQPDGVLHLKVADNGSGKSGVTYSTGFESQLIALLTRQLNGKMREEILTAHVLFSILRPKSNW